MEEKYLEVLEQKICYITNSVKSDKTLLFLHGWGTSKESFASIISKIGESVNIVAVDLPGFGKSEEPKWSFTVEDYANLMNAFIKKKGLKNVIIVAHSFGCRISFYLCLKNVNVKKLILTGAAGVKPKRTFKYHISVISYKLQKILLNTPFYFQYKEDIISQSGSFDYKQASSRMREVLIKSVNEDLRHLFPKIVQPVVLFWGEADDSTPLKDGQLMDEMIPNSKLVVVKGGHYAFLEESDKFYKEIKKLI